MVRKILDGLAVLSFLLTVGILGSGAFGFLWITNEDNQKMLQDKAMEKVMGAIKIPGLSGPALPTSPLTPQQQKIEQKKSVGLPFMSINHMECYEQEPQVFGDSFKQVF